jgi:hypothetical protein
MANIAEGWFDIASDSAELLADLEQKVLDMADRPMFSYGGGGSYPEVDVDEGMLSVVFTSRWNCELVFAWLESLLDPTENYPHLQALIDAAIDGEGRESSGGYKEEIAKVPGAASLTRTEIDLDSLGFWGLLARVKVFDMTAGEKRKDMGGCAVNFHCHERETVALGDGQGPRTRLKLGVYFQCQATECVILLDENGAIVESSYTDEYDNTDPDDSQYYGEMLEDLDAI